MKDRTGYTIKMVTIVGIALAVLYLGSQYIVFSAVHQQKVVLDSLSQSNQIQACRAQAHIPVDQAGDLIDDVRAQREAAVGDALKALATDDRVAFAEAVSKIPEAKVETDAKHAQTEANKAYAAAVTQSIKNPSAFLANCNA